MPPKELTDSTNSPVDGSASKAEKVVPDSFSDWLARPSATITAGSEPEQGIFVGMLNECRAQVADDRATLQRRL
jgi:hypothetical protein